MTGMDNATITHIPADIERVGGHPVLSDEEEIAAAFAARDALDSLGAGGRHRVLTWLAEGCDLTPPMMPKAETS